MNKWERIKARFFYGIIGIAVGLIISLDFVCYQTIEMSKAGVSMWVFFAVGSIVILLEIVPAAVILKSFFDSKKQASYSYVIDWKSVKSKLFYWTLGMITGSFFGIDLVWARSINIAEAGVAFWVFVAVGLFIIMLQLIPAIILFFTMVATLSKKEKEEKKNPEEEKPEKEKK